MAINIQRFGGRGAFSSFNAKVKKDIINIVNNGQVFDFSAGPTMTLISRYENGDFRNLWSSGDSPTRAFEQEIVPYLKDEFVVVDDGTTKTPRYSRFKKYGYEKVGEINETDRNIMENLFSNKENENQWANKWVLMRKKGK